MDAEDTWRQGLAELEARAVESAGKLVRGGEPLVIEFAGSPKSGKSTTIEILTHFFKRTGFSINAPTEGASKRTPSHLRSDLVAFNSWTLCYGISELLSAYYDTDRPSLIFLDRGIFDSLAWIGLLKHRGELSDDEYEAMKQFAINPKWSILVSRLYLFTCDPEVSLTRETESKLTLRGGTAMNPETLQALLDEYKEVGNMLSGYPVTPVDTTTGTSAQQTSKKLAEDILSMLELASSK